MLPNLITKKICPAGIKFCKQPRPEINENDTISVSHDQVLYISPMLNLVVFCVCFHIWGQHFSKYLYAPDSSTGSFTL